MPEGALLYSHTHEATMKYCRDHDVIVFFTVAGASEVDQVCDCGVMAATQRWVLRRLPCALRIWRGGAWLRSTEAFQGRRQLALVSGMINHQFVGAGALGGRKCGVL